MKTIIQLENALFDKWSEIRSPFCCDGMINEDDYTDSKIKVLLILKEVNSKNNEPIDLRERLVNNKFERKATWNNVAKWVYGIKNIGENILWEELINKFSNIEERITILSSIIVMNLKKSPGKQTTDKKRFKEAAKEDKLHLNNQFQIYFENSKLRPDIIIAGGSLTSKLFNSSIDIPNKKEWMQTSRGVSYFEFDKGRYFIKYAHPEARVGDNLLYYSLVDAVKELRNMK